MLQQIAAAVLNVVTTNQIHALFYYQGLIWLCCN